MTKTQKKAIIFDLDNTIYPVASIGSKLFRNLFLMIEEDGSYRGELADIKEAIQRKPFQVVAKEYEFSKDLTEKGLAALSDLEYTERMEAFEDYPLTQDIGLLKFLVTTGFTKLQWSKIKQLDLDKDFEACLVVDPALSKLTKKDVFADIMEKYKLKPEEVLVVGDDIHSEIKAGMDLGIDTVVYDYSGTQEDLSGFNIISHYNQLEKYI